MNEANPDEPPRLAPNSAKRAVSCSSPPVIPADMGANAFKIPANPTATFLATFRNDVRAPPDIDCMLRPNSLKTRPACPSPRLSRNPLKAPAADLTSGVSFGSRPRSVSMPCVKMGIVVDDKLSDHCL
jgi:hypothetical protein